MTRTYHSDMREYIAVYFSYLEEYSGLSDEDFGALIRAGLRYASTGQEPELSGWLPMLWPTLRHKIDAGAEAYEKVCSAKRKAAEARWNNMHTDADACTSMHMDAYAYKKKDKREIIKEKDTPNGVSKKKSAFAPPSQDEATAYFLEKGGTSAEAERFMDYYTANGWKVGKNQMKDWQAAVRNWLHNNRRQVMVPQRNAKANAQQQLMEMIQGGVLNDGTGMRQALT